MKHWWTPPIPLNGRRVALLDEDDPPRAYARTLIGFTAREYTADVARPPGTDEPLEDAEGVWLEGSEEEEDED